MSQWKLVVDIGIHVVESSTRFVGKEGVGWEGGRGGGIVERGFAKEVGKAPAPA